MKYLFVLNNGFYLRNYGTVMRALAAGGNDIAVAFTLSRPGDADLFAASFGDDPNISLHAAPERTGWWWPVADPVRAVRDYIHYLQPAYANAPRIVARGSARVPDFVRRLIGGRDATKRQRLFERFCRTTERALPADVGLCRWLEAIRPDAVLFSPLVDLGYDQVHLLKATKRLAIPTGHLVASWDNLSNKGRIQIPTDLCVVWNDMQKREAIELHGCRGASIVVTGAQLYDDWFERRPSRDRAAFCAELGLDPARPLLLYACSAPFICRDEVPVVERWLKELRAADDPRLRSAQVIVRPHPANAAQWREARLAAFTPVIVSPKDGAVTIAEDDRQLYFDTLSTVDAVIGVNTSVFLEAGIAGTRCFTLELPELAEAQTGTLHYRYLVEGGLLETAGSFAAHHAALVDALTGTPQSAAARQFIGTFLRPRGLDISAVPIAKAAIERLPAIHPDAVKPPAWAPLFRALLWPLAAFYVRPRYLARRDQRPATGTPAERPASRPLHRSRA